MSGQPGGLTAGLVTARTTGQRAMVTSSTSHAFPGQDPSALGEGTMRAWPAGDAPETVEPR